MAGTRILASALRRARQWAVGARRAPLPWIAALALALGVAIDLWRRSPPGDHGTRWLVARHPVPIGQSITAIDFAVRTGAEAPPDALSDGDLHRLRGFRTTRPLDEGAYLVRSAVAPAPEVSLGRRLPFGTRAYVLDRPAGLPLAVGDRVDVLGGDESRAARIAENLPIIAVSDDGAPVAAVPEAVVRVLEETRRRGAMAVVLRRPDEPVRRVPGRPPRRRAIPVWEGDR